MYCGKCGFKNRDDASFCGSCGNKLAVVEVKEEQVESLEDDDEVLEVDNDVDNNKSEVEVPQMVDPNIEDNIPGDVANTFGDEQNNNVVQENNEVVNNQVDEQNNMMNVQPIVNNTNDYNQGYNTIQTFNNNHTANSNKLLYIILVIMGLILIGLLVGVIFVINKPSSSLDTRTVMIYMAGCNLESEGGLASNDLKAILPEEIDLEKTNILVYTGGTKKWYNDFKEDENAIYLLKSTGFEKVKSYNLTNLGDANTFKTFLNFAYNNYSADVYDLIFWDHGLGALGSISDEYSDDYLSIAEMSSALKSSGFSKKKVIETVTFRTCLNGTIEVANTFAPYAKYMIASEEITIGSASSNVLSFLNGVENSDDGIEYGTKFINSYKKQVEEIDFFGTTDSTYSIMELDKVDELVTALGNFVSKIDVKTNYAQLARVRSNLHQYAEGSGCTDYDTVDLKQMVTNLKDLAPNEAEKVLTALKDVIEYNWSTNKFSNGISIYFPFKGSTGAQQVHMGLYEQIDFSKEYHNFINSFYNAKNSSSVSAFSLQNREVSTVNKNEFSIQLTEDEMKNFASAQYIIFQKQDDGTFMPIVNSKDYKLSDSGLLTTNVQNNLLKLKDKDSGEEFYMQATEVTSNDSNRQYVAMGILYSFEGEVSDWEVEGANFDIRVDKNKKPHITKVTKVEKDGLATRVLQLDNFSTVQFTNYRYGILDANGNYNENWQSQNTKYLIELEVEDINKELIVGSLDDADNYYCIFKIADITNNYHYSKLIKIGG